MFLKLFLKNYDYYSEVNKVIDQETLKLFDEIYYATYSDVLKYVIVNCSNIEDVKDIIQNIYLDVLNKLRKNRILVNKPYIMGIAKNKMKDYYRFSYKNKVVSLFSSLKDHDGIDLINTLDSKIDIEKTLLKEEDIEFIWKYLKKQKAIISKIFYLYYYLEYSIKDIAKVLNISESNVKNFLYRTLDKLNALMKDKGE